MDLLPKVFRTEGDVVEFNPSKILESIMKETSMKEEDAKHITELVVRRIISSGIKFLSGPHIREIVCSILSENHFEQERKIYTRIGMPLMDYEEILEKGPQDKSFKFINPEKIHHWAADQLAEEYTLLRILTDDESRAHLSGDIYIHHLKYFDLRPYEQIWDPRLILKHGLPPFIGRKFNCKSGPSKYLLSAVSQLAKWLGMIQSEFSGNQGYDFITIFLAPYVRGLKPVEIKKSLRNFIHEINHISTITSKEVLKSSISCYPTVIEELGDLPALGPSGNNISIYKEYGEEVLKIFDAFTEIFIEGDFYKNQYFFPKHLVYFNKKWLNKFSNSYSEVFKEIKAKASPCLINFCLDKVDDEIKKRARKSFINHGILQKISLNLPRYAYISQNEERFLETIKEKLHLCFEIFEKKYDIIKRRLDTNHLPMCSGIIQDQPIFNLDNQIFSIGFIGLNEAVKVLVASEMHESSEAFSIGKKIVLEMDKICKENSLKDGKTYHLIENISNKAMFRFARLDLKHFPKLAIPKYKGERVYYTNSTHFSDDNKLTIKDEIIKQGEFQNIIQHNIFKLIPLTKIEAEFDGLKDFLAFICSDIGVENVKFTL